MELQDIRISVCNHPNNRSIRGPHLLLLSLCDHILRHTPDTLVDNICHSVHDPFRLCACETFLLQSLDKVMCVKVEVFGYWSRMKLLSPVAGIQGKIQSYSMDAWPGVLYSLATALCEQVTGYVSERGGHGWCCDRLCNVTVTCKTKQGIAVGTNPKGI